MSILYPVGFLCRRLLILILFFVSVGVYAETSELRAEAFRTYQSIEIDGELTDPDWQKATPLRRVIQFAPDAGAP